tara:strand:- start:1018 stop:1149 length:132 start_codon:yes stop_codon:yes gene_type:complete
MILSVAIVVVVLQKMKNEKTKVNADVVEETQQRKTKRKLVYTI